jgi:hypothetical protein
MVLWVSSPGWGSLDAQIAPADVPKRPDQLQAARFGHRLINDKLADELRDVVDPGRRSRDAQAAR